MLHSRFLEDSCISRHAQLKKEPSICVLNPQFIYNIFQQLGHTDHRFFVCSDQEHMHKVQTLLRYVNGSISPFHSLIEDMIFMLYACIFVGNIASTMSVNIWDVRTVIGDGQLRQLLL